VKGPDREALGRAAAPAAALTQAAIAATTAAGLGLAARAVRRRPAMDFKGKSVLITGGSRGLGLLLARRFALAGARLTIVARDPAELELARRELTALGGARVLALPGDVGNRADMEWAVERAAERFGRLDVVVNNAGIIQVGPLEHMTVEDFEEAMAVHFWGPLYTTLAALPHLRRQGGGRIVNIASIGGKIAVPHLVPYSASKFALVGLSNGLQAELAREGIHVTTVCPGLMRTGSHVNALFKGRRREEFTWFALSDSLPLSSMSAERAARRIVEACRYGEPHLILTPQARAATLAAALMPNLTARALQLVNHLLPAPLNGGEGDGDEMRFGWQSASRWAPSLLTRLADEAAVRNNEMRGEATVVYGKNGQSPAPAAGV
jgi:NAD(P)-dependent dehydrogenase (short-subunit alcohol dehydrogenase family)